MSYSTSLYLMSLKQGLLLNLELGRQRQGPAILLSLPPTALRLQAHSQLFMWVLGT